MKNVGILTFHFADNIGAVLQAYALQRILQKMGVNVNFINFVPSGLSGSYKILPSFKRARRDSSIPGALKGYSVRLVRRLIEFHEIQERTKKFRGFRQKFLNIIGTEFEDLETLKEVCKTFDVCIVGSDQVWNPDFLRLCNFGYLLPFKLQDTAKVAYAASVVEKIPYNLLKIFQKCLASFSEISVRESLTSAELSVLLKRRVYHVLDPILLLERSDYNKIMEEYCDNRLPSNYVLIYNIGRYRNNPVFAVAKKISVKIDAPIVTIGYSLKKHYYISPSEFLWLLDNAKYVITNSYHGTLLSIIFKKKLLIIPPSSREIRIVDFLKRFRVAIKTEESKKPFQYQIISPNSCANSIDELLHNYRKHSLNFLGSALKS